MIKECKGCTPHQFQDAKYGKGIRVVNPKVGGKGYSCTVCGKDVTKEEPKTKKAPEKSK